MDFETMNKIAAKAGKEPEGLTAAERFGWLELNMLYGLFRMKQITRAEAVQLKAKCKTDMEHYQKLEAKYKAVEQVVHDHYDLVKALMAQGSPDIAGILKSYNCTECKGFEADNERSIDL
jgi:hypothetical protein